MTDPERPAVPPPYQPPPPPFQQNQPPPYPSYPPYPPYPPFPGPAPKKSRTGLVLALVAAGVLLVVAVVVPVVLLSGDDDSDGPTDDESSQAGGLDEVQRFAGLPSTHVTEPVEYDQVPPVGGEHFAEWLDCGAYDAPVRNENAVHDLEHGAVWITYRPDLDESDVAVLEDALPQNGILSPYDDLPAPVVVTVWGAQLQLTGADDPRLEEFIDEFDDGVTAPEPFASCAGGTATNGDPA